MSIFSQDFTISKTTAPKPKPEPDTLTFGRDFTDHMFVMDYCPEKGWFDGRIIPYGPICLDPAASALHYGQELFEGLKAYRTADNRIQLFRPYKNAERINNSSERICIPNIDADLFVEAVKALVDIDRDWIPKKPGTSLYIRPFIFATDPVLGVRPSDTYKFVVICCPVGSYYNAPVGTLLPTKIFVEQEFVRSVIGGVGFVKAGGNYAAALQAQSKAASLGCEQVLWLDAVEHSYVEEIGTSNAFFMIDDEVITPPLIGTILPGVTRDSVIALLQKWGVKITERRLRIEEVTQAAKEGRLKETFASGTAAVISPVGTLVFENEEVTVGSGGVGALTQRLYDTIYGIQTGGLEDDMGWILEV